MAKYLSLDGVRTLVSSIKNKIDENYYTSQEIDDKISAAVSGVFDFQGTISSESGLPKTYRTGYAYIVKNANGSTNIAGNTCENGDLIIAVSDGSNVSSTQNSHWTVLNTNWTAVDGSQNLEWNKTVTLATIGGVTIDAKLPAKPTYTFDDIDAHPKISKETLSSSAVSISNMEPNKLYQYTNSCSNVVINSFKSNDSSMYEEYMLEFVAASGCTVSVPSNVKWSNGIAPVITGGKTYQISIVNGLGVWAQF